MSIRGHDPGHDPGARRQELLGEARRHRYRLHRLPGLTAELRAVTNELLRQELSTAARAATASTEGPDEERPDRLRWWDR
ncbi:hypothetical protein SL003B_1670 [Polymorphum gilvum SL003B-26A1]|uniref:Uncharacterized protein n=1 Tax=Polymorphum gilvum (strain LMG 25793 / CGMCC 1.9160 / SL003B-26A1) TaxID=991905 RepID=F2J5L4_POLGS|nr:hypothetical protein SL003B_1670 [Polymorphum gilvum SL003B-26A1]